MVLLFVFVFSEAMILSNGTKHQQGSLYTTPQPTPYPQGCVKGMGLLQGYSVAPSHMCKY